MRNWFRELSQLLIDKYQSASPPRAISEFDPFNEEFLTFIDHADLPETFRGYAWYKGSVFSEEDKRWKPCHSFMPEMFGKLNNQLYSFKEGKVYVHEKGGDSSFSTFYGVKYDCMIEPVFNQAEASVKSWQNIAVVSTYKWSVSRFLSENRGAKAKQLSSIPLTSFEEKEGIYYSDIKNDANTPNVTNPLITGAKMRSKAIQALLVLDPAVVNLALLHYVDVGFIDSPKNL